MTSIRHTRHRTWDKGTVYIMVITSSGYSELSHLQPSIFVMEDCMRNSTYSSTLLMDICMREQTPPIILYFYNEEVGEDPICVLLLPAFPAAPESCGWGAGRE